MEGGSVDYDDNMANVCILKKTVSNRKNTTIKIQTCTLRIMLIYLFQDSIGDTAIIKDIARDSERCNQGTPKSPLLENIMRLDRQTMPNVMPVLSIFLIY